MNCCMIIHIQAHNTILFNCMKYLLLENNASLTLAQNLVLPLTHSCSLDSFYATWKGFWKNMTPTAILGIPVVGNPIKCMKYLFLANNASLTLAQILILPFPIVVVLILSMLYEKAFERYDTNYHYAISSCCKSNGLISAQFLWTTVIKWRTQAGLKLV